MELKVFEDKPCDFILHWLVCDTSKVDEEYVRSWMKQGKTYGWCISNYKAFRVVASFYSKEDAEEYVRMMRKD